MHQIQKDFAGFIGHFDEFVVSIHKGIIDAQSKSKNDQYFDDILKFGENKLKEADSIIELCMKFLGDNGDDEISSILLQMLVSYRPRLEGELNLLKDALKGPKVDEQLFVDSKFEKMLDSAQLEMLEFIQQRKDYIEQLKSQGSNNDRNSTQEDGIRYMELQNIKRNNNDEKWIQKEEIENYAQIKKESRFTDNDFDFPDLSSDSDPEDDRKSFNEEEREESNSSSNEDDSDQMYSKRQNMADDLLSQFLGK